MSRSTQCFIDVSDDSDVLHGTATIIPEGEFRGDDEPAPPIPPGIFHCGWTPPVDTGEENVPPLAQPQAEALR